MAEIINPAKIAEHHFNKAVARLSLGATMIDYLRSISRELSFTMILDNGKLFRGYLVQHDCTLGLYKGGVRFFPKVDLDEFRGLGQGMTWKTSFHNLPLGGMKGGVDCDPKTLTKKELKEICEKFIDETFHWIGPEMAVLGPDAGVTAEMMGWMMKRYSLLSGVPNIWGAVTGKPIELHGSYGRKDATGTGGAAVILEALKKLGININGCRIIAEGFGNVNMPAVKILHKNGAKIIGLSDSSCAILKEDGFEGNDIKRAIELKNGGRKPLSELGIGQAITQDDLFSRPCDVWVSAAVGTTITAQRAKSMDVRIIAELGNICATIEADEVFRAKNITVLSDTMASGGGVVVSWHEMEQNRRWEQWSEKIVLTKLQKHMRGRFESGWRYSQEKGLYLRDAVYDLAVQRVVDTRLCTIC